MKPAAFISAFAACLFAFAAASLAATDDDGLRHYKIGDLEIIAIRDAETSMDKSLVPDLANYPEFDGVFANGPAPAVSQTFFLKNGGHNALIDAGWGSELKIRGRATKHLQDMGVRPDEISDILLTHLDHDHIGGLLENGKPVFPNAVLWISEPEFLAWSKGEIPCRGDASIERAQKTLEAYKGRVRLFKFGDEILPGVKSVDARGHTPGHAAFDVSSGDGKMIIAGDILHIGQIQLQKPELSTIYDGDPKMAAESRKRLLERAARKKAVFAGMHFPMISDVRSLPSGSFVMKEAR